MLLLYEAHVVKIDMKTEDTTIVDYSDDIDNIGTLLGIVNNDNRGILIVDTNDFVDYRIMKLRNGGPITVDNILNEAIKPYSDIGIPLEIQQEIPWSNGIIKHLQTILRYHKNSLKHNFTRIISNFNTEKHEFSFIPMEKPMTESIYKDFSKEVSRITENKNKKEFVGHPTNYIFNSFYNFDASNLASNLLYELYQYGRSLSKFIYIPMSGDISYMVKGLLIGHNILLNAENIKSVDVEDNILFESNIFRIPPIIMHRSKCLYFIKCRSEGIMMNVLSTLSANNLTNFTIINNTSYNYDEAVALVEIILNDHYQIYDKDIIKKIIDESNYDKREKYHLSDIEFRTKVVTQEHKMMTIFDNYQEAHEKTRNTLVHDKNIDNKFKYFIGLEEPKRLLENIIQVAKFGEWMKSHHHRISDLSNHMVFTGNPGTGKTTMAKMFAEALRECNILSKDDIVHVGRSDLVGKYVGWTANKVKEKFNEAKGGVLFIDEAYSLIDDHKNSFGDEAINTIVDEMEKNRHDVIVIFAGYTQPMKDFIDINPGLKSRISFWIDFPDYSIDELCEILKVIVEKKLHMKITNAAIKYCREIFQKHINDSDFGNARFARNLAHQLLIAHAIRVKDRSNIDDRDMITITKKDAENINLNEISSKNNHIGFNY